MDFSTLRKKRLNAKLTLDDISNILNIRKIYLQAIEENNLDESVALVYWNGYIKLYNKYLEMQAQKS